jgi:hypothetical protein
VLPVEDDEPVPAADELQALRFNAAPDDSVDPSVLNVTRLPATANVLFTPPPMMIVAPVKVEVPV